MVLQMDDKVRVRVRVIKRIKRTFDVELFNIFYVDVTLFE
jgi:hypothetical protein